MHQSDYEEGTEVDIDVMNVVIAVPTSIVHMNITASVLDANNKIMKLRSSCDMPLIFGVRDDYAQYHDPTFDMDEDFKEGDDRMYVVTQFPREAIAVEIDEFVTDSRREKFEYFETNHLNLRDIHEARERFLERIEFGDEYNARYSLTEKGKHDLDDILSGKKTAEEVFGIDFMRTLRDD